MTPSFRAGLAALLSLVLLASATGCVESLGRVKNARTGPGESAKDYLSDADYSKLVVEIDTVSGAEPNSEALAVLKATLARHLTKPGGITYDTSGSGSVPGKGSGAKYSFQEIDALEKEHRSRYSAGDTAALYILYIDGGSTEDTSEGKVLGASYHGSSVVMFKGNIRDATKSTLLSPRPDEKCVERAVAVHEAGHVLGLVNHGTPMVRNHEDPDHRGHSSNRDSVMYYAVENTLDLFSIFTGGCSSIPFEFDADDKADMRAAGGK